MRLAGGEFMFRNNRRFSRFLCTSLAATCLAPILVPTAAAAQALDPDAAPQDTQEAEETGAIADIVVTARYRNEALQDTPLSIAAFNARTIENSVITDVRDVQKFLPNVQLSRISFAGNALGASIRGVSFIPLQMWESGTRCEIWLTKCEVLDR